MSGLEGRGGGKRDGEYLETGQHICLAAEDEGEAGTLASGGFEDTLLFVKTEVKGIEAQFEIYPQTRYSAKIALEQKKASLKRHKSHDQRILKELEEGQRREQQANESSHSRSEGKVVRYGQIVQLRHAKTGYFLSGNAKRVAELERDCGALTLEKEGSEACYFAFHPRYKEKSEGDKIASGDNVVLVHIKSSFHVHQSSFTDDNDNYEVNLSPSVTSWKPVLQEGSKTTQSLHSGDAVRMLHQDGGVVFGNILFMDKRGQKHIHQVSLLIGGDSLSFNTIWVMESEFGERGRSLAYGQPVRFRHLTTRAFLSINSSDHSDNKFLGLTADPHSPDTLFAVLPVTKSEHDEVQLGVYMRLKHITTEMWMYVLDANEGGSGRHQRTLLATPKLPFNDAFKFQLADKSQVEDAHYVLNTMPAVTRFLSLLADQSRTYFKESNFDPIQLVLEDLIRFCTSSEVQNVWEREGTPLTSRQNFLGSPLILHKFIQLLRRPFSEFGGTLREKFSFSDIDNPDHAKLKETIRLVYRLLRQMAIDNHTNGQALYEFIDTLHRQAGFGLGVLDAVVEILLDNTILLSSMSEEQVVDLIRLAQKTRDPMAISILSVCCVSREVAIPSNQNAIVSSLFFDDQFSDLLVRFKGGKLKDGEPTEMKVAFWATKGQFIPLSTFIFRGSRKGVEYLQEMIALYSHLCFGRNYTGINVIRTNEESKITFRQVLRGYTDETLPYQFRQAFCRLLLNCYIDCYPYSDIRPKRVWPIGSAALSKRLVSHAVIRQPNTEHEKSLFYQDDFDDMIEFVVETVCDDSAMLSVKPVFLETLNMLCKLISFGIINMNDPEVGINTRLMPRFLDIIDMADSTISISHEVSAGYGRMSVFRARTTSREGGAGDDIKIAVCKALEAVVARRLTNELRGFMEEFIQSCDIYNEDNDREARVLEAFDNYFGEIVAGLPDPGADTSGEGKESWEVNRILTRQLGKDQISDRLMSLTLKLAMQNVNIKYGVVAFSRRIIMLSTPTDIQVYIEASRDVQRLHANVSALLTETTASNLRKSIKSLIKILYNGEKLASHRNRKLLKPDPKHQEILARLGVHEEVFEILKVPTALSSMNASVKGVKKVLITCHVFLQVFCQDNPDNQQLIYQNRDLLFAQFDDDVGADGTVTAVLKGNVTLCNRVTKDEIEVVTRAIASSAERRKSELLEIFRVMINPKPKVYVSRNQRMILQSLLGKKKFTIYLYKNTDRSRAKMKQLVTQGSRQEMHPALQYHADIVAFLALTSWGKMHETESLCQELISVDMCLAVAIDEEFPADLRRVYVAFLDEVYLKTGLRFNTDVLLLQENDNLWQLCSKLTAMVKNSLPKSFQETMISTGRGAVTLGGGISALPRRASNPHTDALMFSMIRMTGNFLSEHYRIDHAAEKVEYSLQILHDLLDSLCLVVEEPKTLAKYDKHCAESLYACLGAFAELGPFHEKAAAFQELLQRHVLFRNVTDRALDKATSGIRPLIHAGDLDNSRNFGQMTLAGPGETVAGLRSFGHVATVNDKATRGIILLIRQLANEAAEGGFEDGGVKRGTTGRTTSRLLDGFEEQAEAYHTLFIRIIRDQQHSADLKLVALRILRTMVEERKKNKTRGDGDPLVLKKQIAQNGGLSAVIDMLHIRQRDVVAEALHFLVVMMDGDGASWTQQRMLDYFNTIQDETFFADVRDLFQIAVSEAKLKKRMVVQAGRGARTRNLSISRSAGMGLSLGPILAGPTPSGVEGRMGPADALLVGPTFSGRYLPDLLRMLKLLVIGQNKHMQRYLVLQEDNITSYDILKELCMFLLSIVPRTFEEITQIDDGALVSIKQALDTLREMALGSHPNQLSAISYNIIEALNEVLNPRFNPHPKLRLDSPPQKRFLAIKLAATEILLLFTESNEAATARVIDLLDANYVYKNTYPLKEQASLDVLRERAKKERQRIKAEKMQAKYLKGESGITDELQTLKAKARPHKKFLRETKLQWQEPKSWLYQAQGKLPGAKKRTAAVHSRYLNVISSESDEEGLEEDEPGFNEAADENLSPPYLHVVAGSDGESEDEDEYMYNEYEGTMAESACTRREERQKEELVRQPKIEPGNEDLGNSLAINSYKLIKVLGEFNETRPDPDKALRKVLLKSDDKYRHLIGRIEVITERKLERMYFPIEDFCLTKNTKKLQNRLQQRLIDPRKGCNWNSPSEKINAFTHWCEEILIEMEHKKEINESRFKSVMNHYRWYIRFASLSLILLLNLMVLVSGDGKGLTYTGDFRWFFIYPMQLLGMVQMFLAGLFLIIYIQGPGTVNFYEYWRTQLPPNADPKGILATKYDRHHAIGNFHRAPSRWALTLWYFRKDLRLLWFTVYFFASFLAVLVSPYFYAIHLFDIFIWSPHLLTIANALYLQRVKLVLTVMLLIVVMYAYSVLAFFVLDRYFNKDSGLWCDTPYRCFISNIAVGISMGGSTWEFLEPIHWEDDGPIITVVFVLFTLAYFFAVGVILLNIIFAIIVDTFGQLRDKQQDIQMEQYIRCFICSIESDTFQKQKSKNNKQMISTQYGANRFQRHVEEDHNPWHYLWFFWHLKMKVRDKNRPEDIARILTPNEYYVYKQITRGDFLSFIPIDRAIVLEKTKNKDGLPEVNANMATILQKINRVGTQVSKIGKRLQRLEDDATSAFLRDARDFALSPQNTPRLGRSLQVPGGGRIRGTNIGGRPLLSSEQLLRSAMDARKRAGRGLSTSPPGLDLSMQVPTMDPKAIRKQDSDFSFSSGTTILVDSSDSSSGEEVPDPAKLLARGPGGAGKGQRGAGSGRGSLLQQLRGDRAASISTEGQRGSTILEQLLAADGEEGGSGGGSTLLDQLRAGEGSSTRGEGRAGEEGEKDMRLRRAKVRFKDEEDNEQ